MAAPPGQCPKGHSHRTESTDCNGIFDSGDLLLIRVIRDDNKFRARFAGVLREGEREGGRRGGGERLVGRQPLSSTTSPRWAGTYALQFIHTIYRAATVSAQPVPAVAGSAAFYWQASERHGRGHVAVTSRSRRDGCVAAGLLTVEDESEGASECGGVAA